MRISSYRSREPGLGGMLFGQTETATVIAGSPPVPSAHPLGVARMAQMPLVHTAPPPSAVDQVIDTASRTVKGAWHKLDFAPEHKPLAAVVWSFTVGLVIGLASALRHKR